MNQISASPAPAQLTLSQMRPATTFILGRAVDRPARDTDAALTRRLTADIEAAVIGGRPGAQIEQTVRLSRFKRITIYGFTYSIQSKPSWLIDSEKETLNVSHRLALVLVHRNQIAIHLSHPADRDLVERAMRAQPQTLFTEVALYLESKLRIAFAGTSVRMLALSKTGMTLTTVPDSMLLTGQELQHAVDILTMHHHRWKAARCLPRTPLPGDRETKRRVVGINVARSRAWLGGPTEIRKFVAVAWFFMTQVGKTWSTPSNDFLGQFAAPLAAQPAAPLVPVSLHLPAPLSEDNDEDEERNAPRELLDSLRMEISPAAAGSGPLDCVLSFDDEGGSVGDIELAVTWHSVHHVTMAPTTNSTDTRITSIREWLEQNEVEVLYVNGYRACTQGLFKQTYPAPPRNVITRFKPLDFGALGVNIGEEKPLNGRVVLFDTLDPANGAVNAPNLFQFICGDAFESPPAGLPAGATTYLVCDDGAMETADFVRLICGPQGDPLHLTIYHAKKASNGDAGRAVSAFDYQEVSSQAQKTLNNLNTEHLANRLTQRPYRKAWKKDSAGSITEAPAHRTEMIAALRQARVEMSKEVVLVQPHLKIGYVQDPSTAPTDLDRERINQLLFLLAPTVRTYETQGATLKIQCST